MKILVVDDEQLARERIVSLLKERGMPWEILLAPHGVAALEILQSQSVDLIFLDIQMPELSGMQMLAQIEQRDFQVIFQTAFDEYAIKAFEANACDYLLKPFSRERFGKALDRALARIGQNSNFTKVETELRAHEGFLDKICVKLGGKTILVPLQEIFAFVSQDHYTTVFTATGEHLVDLSLNHLEERLDPEKFQRLHRNNILATDKIRTVHGGENMQVELSNGKKFPVSRNNRKKVPVHS